MSRISHRRTRGRWGREASAQDDAKAGGHVVHVEQDHTWDSAPQQRNESDANDWSTHWWERRGNLSEESEWHCPEEDVAWWREWYARDTDTWREGHCGDAWRSSWSESTEPLDPQRPWRHEPWTRDTRDVVQDAWCQPGWEGQWDLQRELHWDPALCEASGTTLQGWAGPGGKARSRTASPAGVLSGGVGCASGQKSTNVPIRRLELGRPPQLPQRSVLPRETLLRAPRPCAQSAPSEPRYFPWRPQHSTAGTCGKASPPLRASSATKCRLPAESRGCMIPEASCQMVHPAEWQPLFSHVREREFRGESQPEDGGERQDSSHSLSRWKTPPRLPSSPHEHLQQIVDRGQAIGNSRCSRAVPDRRGNSCEPVYTSAIHGLFARDPHFAGEGGDNLDRHPVPTRVLYQSLVQPTLSGLGGANLSFVENTQSPAQAHRSLCGFSKGTHRFDPKPRGTLSFRGRRGVSADSRPQQTVPSTDLKGSLVSVATGHATAPHQLESVRQIENHCRGGSFSHRTFFDGADTGCLPDQSQVREAKAAHEHKCGRVAPDTGTLKLADARIGERKLDTSPRGLACQAEPASDKPMLADLLFARTQGTRLHVAESADEPLLALHCEGPEREVFAGSASCMTSAPMLGVPRAEDPMCASVVRFDKSRGVPHVETISRDATDNVRHRSVSHGGAGVRQRVGQRTQVAGACLLDRMLSSAPLAIEPPVPTSEPHPGECQSKGSTPKACGPTLVSPNFFEAFEKQRQMDVGPEVDSSEIVPALFRGVPCASEVLSDWSH